jgi:transcriptional regulator with XRE-family HTH domain
LWLAQLTVEWTVGASLGITAGGNVWGLTVINDDEGVGDRVRRFRRHRKLTQQALADIAGVDKGYISRLEAGEIADPGIDLVERLSGALQVSMRHLADPRWYAGEATELPDWEAALLALPASHLSDEDKDAIVRFIRTIIAAKTTALVVGVTGAAKAVDLVLPT